MTCIGKNVLFVLIKIGESLQTRIVADLVEISPSWLVLPCHKAHLNVTLMHKDDDSLRFKATTWGYDQSQKANPDVMDGSKFIGEGW